MEDQDIKDSLKNSLAQLQGFMNGFSGNLNKMAEQIKKSKDFEGVKKEDIEEIKNKFSQIESLDLNGLNQQINDILKQ